MRATTQGTGRESLALAVFWDKSSTPLMAAAMLRHLRLLRTERFQGSVAVWLASRMVAAFVDGRPGPRGLGYEVGGIAEWDDIVVEEADGNLVHHQVKFYQADLPSTLSSPFVHLARYFRTLGNSPRPSRTFKLILPSPATTIWQGVEVRHLQELCELCANEPTTPGGLAERAAEEPRGPIQRSYDWLTTQCDFRGWDEVLRVLRHLTVTHVGGLGDLDQRAEEALETAFKKGAREAVLLYLLENQMCAGPITPRLLADGPLRELRKNDHRRWIHYAAESSAWSVAACHGAADGDVGAPHKVVDQLWTGGPAQRLLRVGATWPKAGSERLSASMQAVLARLALHLSTGAGAEFKEVEGWRVGLDNTLGGTLGLSDGDGVPDGWWPLETPQPGDARPLDRSTVEREVDTLAKQMDAHVWRSISQKIEDRIANLRGEVGDSLGALWRKWSLTLNSSVPSRHELLCNLLQPKAEDREVGYLRVGPRTVDILTDALFLLLVVAIAIGEGNASWSNLGAGRTMRALALKKWAPRDGLAPVEDDFPRVVSGEAATVVILSGTLASAGSLEADSFMDGTASQNRFTQRPRPLLLVTNERRLRSRLAGSLLDLQAFFLDRLAQREDQFHQDMTFRPEDTDAPS